MINQRYHKVLAGAGFLIIVLGALIILNSAEENGKISAKVNETEYNVTADGTRYTVPPSKLINGCSGKDCIPSIDDPEFVAADDSDWLKSEDKVIGLEMNGEARAYPLRILNVHEIVNDRIDGKPVAVTYCPLCRSGLTYSREVDNRTLEFGVSGKLYNANLIMYDRQTETYWSQVQGEAVVGPLVPRKLDLVFSEIVDWKNWTEKHPDTRVLSRQTGIYPPSTYGSSPYEGYEESSSVGFGVSDVDSRFGSKDIVYGVNIGGETKAYSEEIVRNQDLIQDTVGDAPVLVLEDQQTGAVKIYLREVNDKTIEFQIGNRSLVDQKGAEWSFEGNEREGNRSLKRLNSHGFYWFAWSEFNPDTDVYRNQS